MGREGAAQMKGVFEVGGGSHSKYVLAEQYSILRDSLGVAHDRVGDWRLSSEARADA